MHVESMVTTQTHAYELWHIWFVFNYKYTVAIFGTTQEPFISNCKRSDPKRLVFML